MPWDGCELWCGNWTNRGSCCCQKQSFGGVDESIFQPEFSPDGRLYFVSDRSGWWNIYRHADGELSRYYLLRRILGCPSGCSVCRCMDLHPENTLVATYILDGLFKICMIEINTGDFELLSLPFVEIRELEGICWTRRFFGWWVEGTRVIVSLETGSEISVLYHSASATLDAGNVSRLITVTVPVGKNEFAHGFLPSAECEI